MMSIIAMRGFIAVTDAIISGGKTDAIISGGKTDAIISGGKTDAISKLTQLIINNYKIQSHNCLLITTYYLFKIE
jgi:hypothetical protein